MVILVIGVSTLSLLSSMFITYINGQATKTPPKYVRIVFFKYLARVFCFKNDQLKKIVQKMDQEEVDEEKKGSIMVKLLKKRTSNETTGNDVTDGNSNEQSVDKLDEVLLRLEEIVAHLNGNLEMDDSKTEWIMVGRILDRIFFWCTVILLLIFALLIIIN